MGSSAPPHPPGTGRRAGRGPSDHGHVRRPPRSPTCRGSEAFRMVQTSTPGGDPKCTEPEAPALAALPGRALSSPGCSSSDGAEPVTSGQTGSGPREAGASNTRALPAGGGVRGSVTGRVRAKSSVEWGVRAKAKEKHRTRERVFPTRDGKRGLVLSRMRKGLFYGVPSRFFTVIPPLPGSFEIHLFTGLGTTQLHFILVFLGLD